MKKKKKKKKEEKEEVKTSTKEAPGGKIRTNQHKEDTF